MKIVVDERERDLYSALVAFTGAEKNQAALSHLQLSKEVLELGDISIRRDEDDKEWVLLERKTMKDLVSSIKDGRYEEQSYRITHALPASFRLHNVCYILEGQLAAIRQNHERKMIMGAMASLYFFKGFEVFRTSSVDETAEWIAVLASKIERGLSEGKMPWFIRWVPERGLGPIVIEQKTTANIIAPVPDPRNEVAENEAAENPTEESRRDDEGNPDNGAVELAGKEGKQYDEEMGPNLDPKPKQEQEQEQRMPDKAYSTVVKRVKSANLTPVNIGEVLLCQIPTIGSETAAAIMRKYGGKIPQLIKALETEGPSCLENLTTVDAKGKSRKISKTCIAKIHEFLLGN